MAQVVYSPHSGKPVKVRDQDVGRAVRDEQGKVFYVLPRASGGGYFGSRTRAGGEAEERHAEAMRNSAPSQPADADIHSPHDATGKRRAGSRGKLVILLLVLLVLLFAYLFSPWGPYNWANMQRGQTPEPNPLRVFPEQTPPENPQTVP